MKKPYKIIVAFLVILPLSLSLIMCCCLEEVFAATTYHSEYCHDQSSTADHQNNSHRSHECMCQRIMNNDVGNSFDVQLVSSYFYKGLLKNGTILAPLFDDSLLNFASLLADRSPPSLMESSIPIYLKISVLRI